MKVLTLVCVPADEPGLITRGSVFSHFCSKCSLRVAVAPSGQAFIKRNPKAEVICLYCFGKLREMEFGGWIGADGTRSNDRSVVEGELRNAVPNTWKDRN